MMQDATATINVEKQLLSIPQKQNGRSPFSQLLDQFDYPQPQRGDIIQGEILRIEDDVMYVDIGSKRDALVPYEEIKELDDALLDDLSRGDDVPVYITQTPRGDEPLFVSLERGLQMYDWEKAQELFENDEVIELKVVGYNKGGLVVEFGRLQGFVPNSHIPEIRNTHDKKAQQRFKISQIDSTRLLKIIEVTPEQERFVLSATAVQAEEQRRQLQKLAIGDTLTGTVTGLKKFGAFVHVGNGLTGLIHISKIDWQFLDHPADVLALGDEVTVKIDNIEPDRQRLSLDRKALIPGPWEQFADRYQEGDWIEGEVTAVVSYGAFIKLTDEIKGLLHQNEMNTPLLDTEETMLQPGDKLLVRIGKIDVDRKRISLSTKKTYEPV
jgi:small subunit ribosomal protein S1